MPTLWCSTSPKIDEYEKLGMLEAGPQPAVARPTLLIAGKEAAPRRSGSGWPSRGSRCFDPRPSGRSPSPASTC